MVYGFSCRNSEWQEIPASYAVRAVVMLKSNLQTSDATYNESTGWTIIDNIEYENTNETQHTKKELCSKCGEVKSSTTENHTWDSGVVTTEPTATTEGVRTFTCSICNNTKNESFAASYLSDVVKVGDYVDIGIEYRSTTVWEDEYDKNMTGWRVLKVEGSGETGVVTLVSAGIPFYLMSDGDMNELVEYVLPNLNRTWEVLESYDFELYGWYIGFDDDLNNLWASNPKLNASSAHGLTTKEVEEYYGGLYSIAELKDMGQVFALGDLMYSVYNCWLGGEMEDGYKAYMLQRTEK